MIYGIAILTLLLALIPMVHAMRLRRTVMPVVGPVAGVMLVAGWLLGALGTETLTQSVWRMGYGGPALLLANATALLIVALVIRNTDATTLAGWARSRWGLAAATLIGIGTVAIDGLQLGLSFAHVFTSLAPNAGEYFGVVLIAALLVLSGAIALFGIGGLASVGAILLLFAAAAILLIYVPSAVVALQVPPDSVALSNATPKGEPLVSLFLAMWPTVMASGAAFWVLAGLRTQGQLPLRRVVGGLLVGCIIGMGIWYAAYSASGWVDPKLLYTQPGFINTLIGHTLGAVLGDVVRWAVAILVLVQISIFAGSMVATIVALLPSHWTILPIYRLTIVAAILLLSAMFSSEPQALQLWLQIAAGWSAIAGLAVLIGLWRRWKIVFVLVAVAVASVTYYFVRNAQDVDPGVLTGVVVLVYLALTDKLFGRKVRSE